MMLESVYADQRLMHTWRAFSFCYSRPSLLLLRENSVLVDTIDSDQGVRQGCVLGGLGYANALQPAYAACARGRDSTTVRAIMDDLAICGPPAEAFAAYAKYVEMATARGVEVNRSKTHVQQPAGAPTAETVRLALEHGLPIRIGNHKYVGGYIGVDDLEGSRFVSVKLAKHDPIMRAIRDPAFPSHLALRLAKVHVLPRPLYLLRALPMRVTAEPMAVFDAALRTALSHRLELPPILPPSALVSMTQPVGSGGMGLRALELIGPAAKWAAAVAAAPDLAGFVGNAGMPLPCVLDRENAYHRLREAGVRVADLGCATFADVLVTEEEKKAWGPFADPRLLVLPRGLYPHILPRRSPHPHAATHAFTPCRRLAAGCLSRVASAALPTASASRRAAPSTRASGFLRTRSASRSRTSSFPSPCVCALACPLFRSRCLLSVLCAKNTLTPGMRSHALPCVGARSPPAMTAACSCWFATRAPTVSWHALSPRTWARVSPTASLSSRGKWRPLT